MSKFSENILSHKIPTADEWTEHLKEAHKIAPSMTPEAFAGHTTESGKNSYELLAGSFQTDKNTNLSLLDLACGDGHLAQYLLPLAGQGGQVIGIDMSEGELEVARKNVRDPRVVFHNAKADKLSVADHSIDGVFCHMAFMLMNPIEPVVAEIKRVLKPGASFHAVIGGPTGNEGLWGGLRKTTGDFITARYPVIRQTLTGDPRTQSEEELRKLFGPDFKVEITDFHLVLAIKPEQTWDWMKDMYFVAILPAAEKDELKRLLREFAEKNADSQGIFHGKSSMRLFAVGPTFP